MKSIINKCWLLILVVSLQHCSDKIDEPVENGINTVPSNYVVAFQQFGDIYIYFSSNKSTINITSNIVDTLYYATVASFSSDGRELLYTLDYKKVGREDLLFCQRDDIFSYNLITGQTKRITNNEFREINPKYSKDGKTIIYQSFENGNSDLFAVKNDGSNKKPVLLNPSYEWYPSFLMNDSKILYSSNRNGNSEFYINDITGGNEDKLTNNNYGGSNPSISSDNKYFVFSATEGIYKYDFALKNITLLLGGNSGVKMSYDPIISDDSKYIVYKYFDGSWIYNRLMTIDGKDITNLGKGFDAAFTSDSKYVVSLSIDGMHWYDINSHVDKIVLPYQIMCYDIAVSSIKQ